MRSVPSHFPSRPGPGRRQRLPRQGLLVQPACRVN
jgi:hypothetical protein